METEEAQFLRTIRAAPYDDTPRLVYADWLEENGRGERAEFIRVQCARETLGEDEPRRIAIERRERLLWRRHAQRFRSELPSCLRRSLFHRGFVYPTVPACSVEEWLAYPKRAYEAAPLWNLHLIVTPAAPIDDLVASGRLNLVAQLHLNIEQAAPNALDEIFGDTSLTHLRSLVISGRPFDLQSVTAVARSPALTELRRLGINCNPIGAEGAAIIAGSPYLGKLESLDLFGCGVGDRGVRALADSRNLHNLRELNLTHNGLDDDAASAIIASRHFKNLVALKLFGNHLGDAGARALAHGRNLGCLSALDLGLNRIGPTGGRALADSPYLLHLRQLYLGGNRVSDDPIAIDALRTRFGGRVTV